MLKILTNNFVTRTLNLIVRVVIFLFCFLSNMCFVWLCSLISQYENEWMNARFKWDKMEGWH